MRTYYLENARPSDLADLIKGILPAGSSVSADDTYNVLVVQTSSDYLPRLEKLIKELDISPTQVMIEVRMIEVQHTDGGTVGLNAKYTNPKDKNDTVQTVGQAGKLADTGAQGLFAFARPVAWPSRPGEPIMLCSPTAFMTSSEDTL